MNSDVYVPAARTVSKSGGTGRKECPGCGGFLGTRTLLCPRCGHRFGRVAANPQVRIVER